MHCDWLKIVVPCVHSKCIRKGVIVKFEDDLKQSFAWGVPERLMVEGSFSSSVSVRTLDTFKDFLWQGTDPKKMTLTEQLVKYAKLLPLDWMSFMCDGIGQNNYKDKYFLLEISGNPVKFLQGHSLHGSDNLLALTNAFILDVTRKLDLVPTLQDLAKWRRGQVYLQRLDVCEGFKFQNADFADQFISSIVRTSSMTGKPFRFDHNPKDRGFTAVHATAGQLCRFSFYNKYYDLLQNKGAALPFDSLVNDRFIQDLDGVVRCEAKLKSSFFSKNDVRYVYEFVAKIDLRSIIYGRLDKMVISKNSIDYGSLDKLQSSLPSKLLPMFLLWRQGTSVKSMKDVLYCGNPKTISVLFCRHSKELREYGINVRVRLGDQYCTKNNASNVVPFFKTLEAKVYQPCQEIIDKTVFFK
ncbi:MAG: phage/plasmid replication protein, II/X family [Mariprofundaceae bacterium]|nr:phage/plasmid replication protein, II/X family [Mariprofundaceae bacterium]